MKDELKPELLKAAEDEYDPTKLKADEELSPAVRQAYMEFMLPSIAKGVWEGIYALPEEAREIVFKAQAKRYDERLCQFAGFDPSEMNDVDEFMVKWEKAFGGMMKGKREGDTIYWEFATNRCADPMVMLGLVEPNPILCQCDVLMVKGRFEKVTKSPVTVELLDSVLATGANKCSYLIHLRPPLENAGSGKFWQGR